MAAPFIPGLDLARLLYAEVVGPLLEEITPRLRYSAALLGAGSEVLGFDTPRSTDHDWGPRLQIFLAAGTPRREVDRISHALTSRLPAGFRGYPIRFPLTGEPSSAARHHVTVAVLGHWMRGLLGFDPLRAITLLDWLATPTQRLAELTGGAVFHDGLSELEPLRARMSWYPSDVWRYVLACQWHRIAQEEPFAGRSAEVGDTLGSAVLVGRLARDLMRLCLLMDRRYPPYSKWLGSTFAQSAAGAAVGPALAAALAAPRWRSREQHLATALRAVGTRHNQLGLTEPVPATMRWFYQRPYLVLGGDRFTAALRTSMTSARIRDLPLAGAVDQLLDNTDALGDAAARRAATAALLHLSPGEPAHEAG
jgi:Domain of unknown function (DUF4037)